MEMQQYAKGFSLFIFTTARQILSLGVLAIPACSLSQGQLPGSKIQSHGFW